MEHQVEQLRAGRAARQPDRPEEPAVRHAHRAEGGLPRDRARAARDRGGERPRRAVSGRSSWRSARFLVVDVETTGLDLSRDEIVSFAGVPVEEGRALAGGRRRAGSSTRAPRRRHPRSRSTGCGRPTWPPRPRPRRRWRRLRPPCAAARPWRMRPGSSAPSCGGRCERSGHVCRSRIVDTALLWRMLSHHARRRRSGLDSAGGRRRRTRRCRPTARTSPRVTRSRPRRCCWRWRRTSRRTGRGAFAISPELPGSCAAGSCCARERGQLRLNAARISRWNSSTCSRMIVRARSPSRPRRAFSRCIWSWTEWPRPGTRSSTRYQMRSEWVK